MLLATTLPALPGRASTLANASARPAGRTQTLANASGRPSTHSETLANASGHPTGRTETLVNAVGRPGAHFETLANASGYPGGPAATVVDAGWRQDGGGPGRAGFQPVAPRLDATAAARLDRAWTAPADRPDEQIGGAVVVDGTLFRSSGGPSGQVRRYDAVVGNDLGPLIDVPGRQFGQLAVVDGTIVVESLRFTADDQAPAERFLSGYRRDGQPLWERSLPDAVSGGYTVADGMVLRSAGSTLTAYRLNDGTTAWTAALDGEPGYHPPVADGGVALQPVETRPGATLLAFDLRTGRPAWRQAVSGPGAIAAGGSVYTTGEGGVCAYAVADGSRRWCDARTLPGAVAATASSDGLFALDGHGRIAAFARADGTVRWIRDYGLVGDETATSFWSPVNGGGVLFAVVYHFAIRDGVARHRYELLSLDTATGVIVSRLDLDFDAMHGAEPLLLSGDHVYFAAVERLFAFTAEPWELPVRRG